MARTGTKSKPSKRRADTTTPSKLTRELVGQYVDLIRRGVPPHVVNDFLGVSHARYLEWFKRGAAADDAGTKSDAVYVYFYNQVRRAQAKYKIRMIDNLHKAENWLWARDMQVLQRRERRTFGWRPEQGGAEEPPNPDDRYV